MCESECCVFDENNKVVSRLLVELLFACLLIEMSSAADANKLIPTFIDLFAHEFLAPEGNRSDRLIIQ